MPKSRIIYFSILGLLFVLLIAVQHYGPRPVDWNVNFRGTSKTPYGCYVIKDMLGKHSETNEFSQNNLSLYEAGNLGELTNKSLVIITDRFAPDEYDLFALLDFVAEGNTVLLSAFNFINTITDTLNFFVHSPFIDTSAFRSGNEMLNLLNPTLRKDSGYIYNRRMPFGYFASFDSLYTRQLGIDRNGNTNFIKTSFGKGQLLIHCQPMAFTNYHILYGSSEYASAVLAYLPGKDLVWDNYYKPGKTLNASPVRYILSQPALRSSYYIILITILLYMIIESKRRQRKIPIVQPLPNTSLQFIQTIGKLYFKSRNHTDLARKKITYFKEFLRERYYLSTINADKDILEYISSKSGVTYKVVEEIVTLIESCRKEQNISSERLLILHQKIEKFYSTCI